MAPRTNYSRLADYDDNVFVNCPFDVQYKPLFNGVVFTIILCGFRARCALEVDDGSQTRIEKICAMIEECRYGIHDVSRTELDEASRLPRFNMPLELGIFLGIKRSGDSVQRRKTCLVLDTERYRYQKFISDISGQDIQAHDAELRKAIRAVRDWLRTASGRQLPGGAEIHRRYEMFEAALPALCAHAHLAVAELTFADFAGFAVEWLKLDLSSAQP